MWRQTQASGTHSRKQLSVYIPYESVQYQKVKYSIEKIRLDWLPHNKQSHNNSHYDRLTQYYAVERFSPVH